MIEIICCNSYYVLFELAQHLVLPFLKKLFHLEEESILTSLHVPVEKRVSWRKEGG